MKALTMFETASHRKLMLPVMFESITLKYYNGQFTRQLVRASPCTKGVSWKYKGHLEDVLHAFWASYERSISALCLVGQWPFNHLTDNNPGNNAK